jgi:ribosomal protein S15P/S13E
MDQEMDILNLIKTIRNLKNHMGAITKMKDRFLAKMQAYRNVINCNSEVQSDISSDFKSEKY